MRSLAIALAFAAFATAYNNGLGTVPPLGWSTWCTDDICGILDTCWESEIHSVVEGMETAGMPQLGFRTVLFDDCWAAVDRDAQGHIQPQPEQFPSGIPAMVQYLQAKEMKLGLYTCAGPRTCRWNRTGSGDHYEVDSRTFAQWGVRMVKMDNCDHPSEPQPTYYGNFSHYLNTTDFSIHFNICGWGEDGVVTQGWGNRIAQSFRIGLDHLPVWSWASLRAEQALWTAQQRGIPAHRLAEHWPSLVAQLPAPAAVVATDRVSAVPVLTTRLVEAEAEKRVARAEWERRLVAADRSGLSAMLQQLAERYASSLGQGTGDIIEEMASLSNGTMPYGKDDPDFAMTLFNEFLTPFTDSQTEWSFWCLWGGNLLMATDPRNMTAQKQSIVLNKEALAVHQDPSAPPGTRRHVNQANGAQVWARPLSTGDVAAILYNPSEYNVTATMEWQQVGLAGTPAAVRDIWALQDLQPQSSFTRELEAHQVAFLRLKP